jgi:hypothetical protein
MKKALQAFGFICLLSIGFDLPAKDMGRVSHFEINDVEETILDMRTR